MTIEMEPRPSGRGRLVAMIGAAVATLVAAGAMIRLRNAADTHIRMSVTIDRPVGEVFAFVADARNVLEWLPAAVERRLVTGEPIGVGSRFEATDRLGGRMVAHTQEIITFEPDRRVTSRISAPWNGDYEIALESVDGGTLLTVDTTSRPTGMFRVFGFVPVTVMKRQFEQDYAHLKARLEGSVEPVAIPIEPEPESVDLVSEESTTE